MSDIVEEAKLNTQVNEELNIVQMPIRIFKNLIAEVERLREAISWTERNKPSDGFTAGLKQMNLEKKIESLQSQLSDANSRYNVENDLCAELEKTIAVTEAQLEAVTKERDEWMSKYRSELAENAELKQINKGLQIDAGFRETRICTLAEKLTASEKKVEELGFKQTIDNYTKQERIGEKEDD